MPTKDSQGCGGKSKAIAIRKRDLARPLSEGEFRNFKSRWGSCDKKGQVVFNWNIIKAPHAIADYVVVHELCHLIHPNHFKEFWQLVCRHDPAYAEYRQWLKERGAGLL